VCTKSFLAVIVVVFRLPGDVALASMASQDYNLNLLLRSSHVQEQAMEEE